MDKLLVIHPDDRTTDDLKLVYGGLDTEVITKPSLEQVRDSLNGRQRTFFLGHGLPQGLLGTNFKLCVDERSSPLLKDQTENIYIWCNADVYLQTQSLSGFATGMFISEVREAYVFNVKATAVEIRISNRLFSRLVNLCARRGYTCRETFEFVCRNYRPVNELSQYNRQRLRYIENGEVILTADIVDAKDRARHGLSLAA